LVRLKTALKYGNDFGSRVPHPTIELLFTKLNGYIFFLTISITCSLCFIVEDSNSKLTATLAELLDERNSSKEKGSGVEPTPGAGEREELKALREIVGAVRLTR